MIVRINSTIPMLKPQPDSQSNTLIVINWLIQRINGQPRYTSLLSSHFSVLNDYPSGLNYYYFVSTLISVGTMILLRKTTDETKLLAILEAKKKDPKQMKKTGFAARLEAMQKQQEQLQQQKQNKR